MNVPCDNHSAVVEPPRWPVQPGHAGRGALPAWALQNIGTFTIQDGAADAVAARATAGFRADEADAASIYAETLSFFDMTGPGSIDFGGFQPIFRLDAARYRNAIS
jgi:hypothetical protein